MSDKVREAAENLVAVCDDLEAKSVTRTGGARMSGYWLQRDRIDPIREALADNAPPEPTEEMVRAALAVETDEGGPISQDIGFGMMRLMLEAALVVAKKEG
ncbi:hypothetical protein LCGC14_2666610 [marine sediment metagenome]|uniref:Uncharacterized protein n=1 Tax=marine sediment metagenome TaxID=412755 RepID=A0A0F9C0F8_9ZZZZ